MGKYNNGIMGPFSGKVGTVVGSYWKGRFVMRQRPHYQGTRNFTPSQIQQQQKLAASTSFAKMVSGMLNFGYLMQAKNKAISARNVAVSRIMEDSLTISPSGVTVNYATVQVSEGLNLGVALTVTQSGTNLNISWTNNAGVTLGYLSDGTQVNTIDDDHLYIGIYNQTKNRFIMNTSSTRADEAAVVSMAGLGWEAGDVLSVYSFIVEKDVRALVTGTILNEAQRKRAEMMLNEGFGVSNTKYNTVTMS